jgi:predicted RND superfamily exporter protein
VAVSALLVLVGVVLSILLVLRVPRALPALALPLAIGTVWGFGVASLFVSSLGSSTAFLGSIVIGNGINPGIILLARYLEERRRGTPVTDAVTVATATTWRGTLAAAVAAAAGYASLAITSFRGFNEFGVIASSGALACWLATYMFLPACSVSSRFGPRLPGRGDGSPEPSSRAPPAGRSRSRSR